MIGTNHKARVTELINYYGQPVSFTYETEGTFNPATGSYEGGGTTTLDATGYLTRYATEEVDGEVVRMDDLKVYTADVSEEPKSGWKSTVNSKTYRVVSVQKIYKGGSVVHYICQLRV